MATTFTVGDAVEVLFSNQWFPAQIEEVYNDKEYGLSYKKFNVSFVLFICTNLANRFLTIFGKQLIH